MKKQYTIEACVETIESAKEAEKKGADQIELCANLEVGGLTPDFEMIKEAKKVLSIPIRVIVRPRAGHFYYNDDEIEEMIDAISRCRYLNVDGVVIGATTSSKKKLDIELLEELSAVADPLKVTVHKAIDECTFPVKEVARLKKISNIDAVLSSGKAATALEGSQVLKEMIAEGGDRIRVISAGKITSANLPKIHNIIGGQYYHGRKIV